MATFEDMVMGETASSEVKNSWCGCVGKARWATVGGVVPGGFTVRGACFI